MSLHVLAYNLKRVMQVLGIARDDEGDEFGGRVSACLCPNARISGLGPLQNQHMTALNALDGSKCARPRIPITQITRELKWSCSHTGAQGAGGWVAGRQIVAIGGRRMPERLLLRQPTSRSEPPTFRSVNRPPKSSRLDPNSIALNCATSWHALQRSVVRDPYQHGLRVCRSRRLVHDQTAAVSRPVPSPVTILAITASRPQAARGCGSQLRRARFRWGPRSAVVQPAHWDSVAAQRVGRIAAVEWVVGRCQIGRRGGLDAMRRRSHSSTASCRAWTGASAT